MQDSFGRVALETQNPSIANPMELPGMDPVAGGVVSAILGQLRLYGRQHGYQWDHAASDKRRHYVRARHYDSQTAKWMSRDPLGDIDGPNEYTYCGNDGVNAVDPDGYRPRHTKSVIGPTPIIKVGPGRPGQFLTGGPDSDNQDLRVVRDTWIMPRDLLYEFASGTGPTHSVFLEANKLTKIVERIPRLQGVRARIIHDAQRGYSTNQYFNYWYGSLPLLPRLFTYGVMDPSEMAVVMLTPTHHDPHFKNQADAFLGSYILYVETSKIDRPHRTIQVDFHLFNPTGTESATRNPVIGYSGKYKPLIRNRAHGPFRTVTQDFFWSERYHY